MDIKEVVLYIEGLNRDLLRREKSLKKLFDEMERLKKEIELRDRLIELVEPDITWQEHHLEKMAAGKKRDRMAAIVAAYRAVKEGEYEHTGTAVN